MSWHTSGLLIRGDYSRDLPGLLKKLGINNAQLQGDSISFEDATSVTMDGLAAAVVDGWTCLFSCFALFLVDDQQLARIAKQTNIFEFTLEGSTGAAGFNWWSKGKKARQWMVVEGAESVNEGKPLPEEMKVFARVGDDEQRVLQLLEKLTVPLGRLSEVPFVVFSCGDDLDDFE